MKVWWFIEEIKKFLDSNKNEKRTYQVPCDTIRGKFIAMSTQTTKLGMSNKQYYYAPETQKYNKPIPKSVNWRNYKNWAEISEDKMI
jgi:hypothetical protein